MIFNFNGLNFCMKCKPWNLQKVEYGHKTNAFLTIQNQINIINGVMSDTKINVCTLCVLWYI